MCECNNTGVLSKKPKNTRYVILIPLSGIQNLFKNNNFLPEADPAKAGMDSCLRRNDTQRGLFGQPHYESVMEWSMTPQF